MKRCVLVEPGRLVVEEAPEPSPGPRDAVVRVEAALTCGTDLKAFRRGHPKMPCPTPFGHEFSGQITALGAQVDGFSVGDSIMAANTGPCLECFFCRKGQENLCETIMEEMILGAYAEYVLVPERVLRRNAFLKPGELPYRHAALLEPLASVCFGLSHVLANDADADSTALLVGSGPIAMLWLKALRARGIGQVLVAGRRRPRLDLALGLGADAVFGDGDDLQGGIAAATGGRGCDVVVECTGMPAIWEQAPGYARKGGTAVLFGGCPGGTTATFDTFRLHYDGVRLVSPFHFRPRDVAEAQRLLADPKLDFSGLVTSAASLDEVPSVFESLGDSTGLKCAVLPSGIDDTSV